MMHIKIVTPKGVYIEKDVDELHITTVEGQRTILPNHAPLFASVVACPLILRVKGKEEEYAVSGGILQVNTNDVTLLTDAIEGADEIDIERARRAYERAKARIEKRDVSTNMKRSELALARALNRIRIYEHR
ncbi:MAG: ATP synthase F1 subunit epsilon [Erysipelotrichaceae bacterium]|nr:ATP synthase F1 subunit epsilon [Erysipelotrichaceae bacterium]